MILGFLKTMVVNKTRKSTYFKEQIISGIKIHTIRHDPKNRWSAGRKIHFANGVRTSNYNCFKKGTCISVQTILIKEGNIWIDGEQLSFTKIFHLARNDGFESTQDFWEWFNDYQPFEGKLIHWTELKY